MMQLIIFYFFVLLPQEADIAVALFIQTLGRTSVAEPSSPIWYDQAVLVFRRDYSVTSEDRQWLFYLKPFSLSVYLLILGLLLSVLLLLLLLDRADTHMMAYRDIKGNNATATMFKRVQMTLEILIAGLLSKREWNLWFLQESLHIVGSVQNCPDDKRFQ